ncbi:protein-methionine-sulfoxide reductase catalytic subunit MsrP [Acidobacteria bacterium AH-259-G07]|nr:protein-methionine-sulfoxide reductase catalytic subunit MsrP [Acidobacteria bacterium AH-259-G07]
MACPRIKKPWDRIPESEVTPESVYINRREFAKKLGLTGVSLAPFFMGRSQGAETARSPFVAPGTLGSSCTGPYGHVAEFWVKKWAELFPAVRNTRFQVKRTLTDERIFAGYNNFYEFTVTKQRVKDLVEGFEVNPWEVKISGEVKKKGTYDVDDLIRMGKLEERLYHFRCVEAWSANVPWSGYPLSQLIDKLNPSSQAKYVRFVTVYRPNQMPGQKRQRQYPWPYYEALTMEEAMNELALLTFGVYGHPLNKQNGAPVRMVLPWKFGFKNIKSIVKIEFLKRRPSTFWSDASHEYGFWANINPKFDHPRWSQATETFLNTGERIPTRLYNGYGEYVAHLYDENERQFFY